MGDGLLLTRQKLYFTRSSANACSFSYAEICCHQGGGITCKVPTVGAPNGGRRDYFFGHHESVPQRNKPSLRKSAQINTKSILVATRLLNFTIVSILEGEILRRNKLFFWGDGAAAHLPPALCHPPPASCTPRRGITDHPCLNGIRSLDIMKKQALPVNNLA